MLTQERLDQLQQDCTDFADREFDCSVTVEQYETGELLFSLVNEDGKTDATLLASPAGEDVYGSELWAFLDDGNTANEPLVANLVPSVIVCRMCY